ncbi:MAG: amidohydrolase [Spirochaetales bacterium]|nr:amidohydrolase [Spirochaetales bacterium]
MNLNELKDRAFRVINFERDSIFKLSRYINEHPETAFKETEAVKTLTSFFKDYGFNITTSVGGLETAFIADFGKITSEKKYPVAILAEYDALESVGHGCGHNLIAAAAAAASLGVAAAIEEAGSGCFRMIGCPAEEVLTEDAGKTRLIKAGVFETVESCLIFHPWTKTGVALKDLGCSIFEVVFKGQPAHASADPWNGRNALDAAVCFYNSISMMRQQMRPGVKMHCIIKEGGELLNIIPSRTVVEIMLRSTELEDLNNLTGRLRASAEASAAAAGCQAEFKQISAVKPINFNQPLFKLAAENMKLIGEELSTLPVWEASSDVGDVSHEVPAISLLYKTHETGVTWHSKDVAAAAHEDPANVAMLNASKVLAATAIDLIFGKELS